ncbi:signal transduction histidine kinase [Desulfuromonas soudanensis]|uniref:histidine kinase n=1 Tax=Desulfuromonas soudanensis TaxID=1603606 RepID=A0A0M5IVM4_9BACT|nr:ATP-binding protein [Desulfuromonas soudanensis]ALC16036.1 signal transduction histidine kinase [Desulfuromonas soudanensis]
MRLRLITKFTLVSAALLLFGMALLAAINIQTLKTLLEEEAVRDLDNLSETIIRTTHYQMLEDDRERVYQMIREVGSQKEIEHIRLINKDGTIIFSTDQAEIGTMLDKKTEACNMCHAEDQPLVYVSSMNRSRIFSDRNGKQVLGMAKGIYGERSCSAAACHFHPADAKILGVLDVIVSREGMLAQTISYRNNILALTFVLLLLFSLCLTLLVQKMINGPIKNLLLHTVKLSRGEFDGVVEGGGSDELGELTTAFNTMTVNLRGAREEISGWASTLEQRVEERTRELKEMQSRLLRSEKLASLGELAAGIAHEINNPLTGILMFSSMVIDDRRLDPALKGDMETIVRETGRCAEIVRGLLNFARETVPQKRLDCAARIMELTLGLVEHQIAVQNIRVVRDFAGHLPPVLVDPNQLEQVFMNMVINASQAMPQGGTLTVRIEASSRPETLCIGIADTGCGIPEEDLGRIFDPFFSTKEQRGTGLGLAVSFGIIENHQGQIEVESRLGEGTTITISLPVAGPGVEEAPREMLEV